MNIPALAGWGPSVFTASGHWWVVPVLACHAGAVAGAWLYFLLVEMNYTEVAKEEPKLDSRKTDAPLPRMNMTGPGTNYLQVSTKACVQHPLLTRCPVYLSS